MSMEKLLLIILFVAVFYYLLCVTIGLIRLYEVKNWEVKKMAKMQIVIEISEDEYELVRHGNKSFRTELELMNAVADGTPLPKHHGRLKDVDAFISKVKADREHSAYLRSWTADDVLTALDNSYTPTIIEPDKESEE